MRDVNFTVELQPQLPTGNYSIKRLIDIDPNDVWVNYGQEPIGTVRVLETVAVPSVSLKTTGAAILAVAEDARSGIAETVTTTQISLNSLIMGMLLTEKEKKVLELRAKGLDQYEIAKRMKVTQAAVSQFQTNAYRKIKEAVKLIEFAKKKGVVFLP